jgi:hypothetical protein
MQHCALPSCKLNQHTNRLVSLYVNSHQHAGLQSVLLGLRAVPHFDLSLSFPVLLRVVQHLNAVIAHQVLEHSALVEWFLQALHRALVASELFWDPKSASHWLAARQMGSSDAEVQRHLQCNWAGPKLPCELGFETRQALHQARLFY